MLMPVYGDVIGIPDEALRAAWEISLQRPQIKEGSPLFARQ